MDRDGTMSFQELAQVAGMQLLLKSVEQKEKLVFVHDILQKELHPRHLRQFLERHGAVPR